MTTDPLRSDTARTDLDIANDVVNALIGDPGVPDKTITARVHDRWVWLLGEADRPDQRVAAQRAAEAVVGIKGVMSMIHLAKRARPRSGDEPQSR
jgi:osmotically-inducible protein OsmY